MRLLVKNGMLTLAAAALLLPAGLAAADTAYTGVVGDAMCGAKHDMGEKDPAKCTRMCAQPDDKFALVTGKTTFYELDADKTQRVALDKFAGQKVVIMGVLNGKVLTVHSVAAAPKTGK